MNFYCLNKVETKHNEWNTKDYLMNNEKTEKTEKTEKNFNGKFILNFKRVTVWSRNPDIYWTFNTIDEAMDFVKKEKLIDNCTMEVVTCKV